MYIVPAVLAFLAGIFFVFYIRQRRKRVRSGLLQRYMGIPDMPEKNKAGYLARLEVAAHQAGLDISETQILLIALISGALGLIAVYFVTGNIFLSLAGLGLAFYGPAWQINNLAKKRGASLDMQIEMFLSQFSIILKSGTSPPVAFKEAAREIPDPLGKELASVIYQAGMIPFSEAVYNLTKRIKSKEINMFASAIQLSQDTGGDISGLVDIIIDGMRSRRALKGKVEAATADGKLSGNIMLIIVFGLIAYLRLTSPALMAPLFNTTSGLMIFGVCSALVVVGYVVINKMSTYNSQ